ncbi:MAG: Maf family protein [Arenicellales bacterium]
MQNSTQLILASASPRRKELLTRLGINFSIQIADIDETRLADESPIEMTERLAAAKAQVIFDQQADAAWVLGADTTVALGTRIFGKPASKQAAIEILHLLSGNTHQVISSVSLISESVSTTQSVVSNVTFGTLSEAQILAYCDSDEPYDKAGSYGIQGNAGVFVKHIEGDYSAIVGLPLWQTHQLLLNAGLINPL